jgi:hypothetical protein
MTSLQPGTIVLVELVSHGIKNHHYTGRPELHHGPRFGIIVDGVQGPFPITMVSTKRPNTQTSPLIQINGTGPYHVASNHPTMKGMFLLSPPSII